MSFHDLDQIPVFQTQIDPEMMNTADRLEVLQMNNLAVSVIWRASIVMCVQDRTGRK